MTRLLAVMTSTVSLGALLALNPAIAGAKPEKAVCGPAAAGSARCFAHVVTDAKGNPATSAAPAGYGPAQFHGAYSLPTTTSATAPQVIAIVDAYDDPTVLSDLNAYDTHYRLPSLSACTTTSTGPCFAKVNQSGAAGPYPKANSGWALEIALDVETAHQICQNCKIVLVEASSSSGSNLDAAESTAISLGATEISNSWGTSNEYSGVVSENTSFFNHPNVAITVASGDNGYGKFGFPAASPDVIAVGGTTLSATPQSNGSYSYGGESAWSGSGSGCSVYFTALSWQTSLSNWSATGCGSARGVADVAADADPNTGAAVYDTTKYFGRSGWFQVGGTSLASPLIAGVYALAGNAATATYPASIPYGANAGALHDVTSGPSTGSCGGTSICTPGTGYDGPTGMGTPAGLGGF